MNLKNKVAHMAGKTHWAAGYQIHIGADGIARNVPDEAAKEMLVNHQVWEICDGGAGVQKGILPKPLMSSVPSNIPTPVRVQTERVEVPLVPLALGLLESQEPLILERMLPELGIVDEPEAQDARTLARLVLQGIDRMLVEQIGQLISHVTQRAMAQEPETEAPQELAPTATEPTEEPKIEPAQPARGRGKAKKKTDEAPAVPLEVSTPETF